MTYPETLCISLDLTGKKWVYDNDFVWKFSLNMHIPKTMGFNPQIVNSDDLSIPILGPHHFIGLT